MEEPTKAPVIIKAVFSKVKPILQLPIQEGLTSKLQQHPAHQLVL